MRGLKTGIGTLAAMSGLTMIGLAPKPAYAYWQEHYRNEYKVKVKRPTKVYKVVYSKRGTYLNKWYYFTTLQKGEVVRTWYAGGGGFDWHLTGGKHGKYDDTSRYAFDVNWESRKSFKILKTYHGTNWF